MYISKTLDFSVTFLLKYWPNFFQTEHSVQMDFSHFIYVELLCVSLPTIFITNYMKPFCMSSSDCIMTTYIWKQIQVKVVANKDLTISYISTQKYFKIFLNFASTYKWLPLCCDMISTRTFKSTSYVNISYCTWNNLSDMPPIITWVKHLYNINLQKNNIAAIISNHRKTLTLKFHILSNSCSTKLKQT